MAANFCINCGEKLEEGASACAACGEAVPILAVTAATNAGTDHEEGTNKADETSKTGETRETSEASEVSGTNEVAKPSEIPETSETPEPEEDFSSFADFTGFDVMTTDPGAAPAERMVAPPDQTDVMAPIKGMRSASEYRAPQEKKSYTGSIIKIAAGLAAAILLVAGLGLLAQDETRESLQKKIEEANATIGSSSSTDAEASSSTETQTSTTTDATTSSSAAKSAPTVSDAAAYVDDDTAFERLTTVYDSLQSYNERVYSCLQTYNGVFVSPDRGQREAAAGIASSLLAEIEKDMKSLDSMNIGRASSLYDDYENVRHLLDDQYQRLAVVVESYDISLQYDTPYEHQAEILEPLTRDIGPSGQNSYLEDFDAHYWESRPTK